MLNLGKLSLHYSATTHFFSLVIVDRTILRTVPYSTYTRLTCEYNKKSLKNLLLINTFKNVPLVYPVSTKTQHDIKTSTNRMLSILNRSLSIWEHTCSVLGYSFSTKCAICMYTVYCQFSTKWAICKHTISLVLNAPSGEVQF